MEHIKIIKAMEEEVLQSDQRVFCPLKWHTHQHSQVNKPSDHLIMNTDKEEK